MRVSRFLVAGAAALFLTVWGAEDLLAEPPPWAPAHGYRAKGKGKHKQRQVRVAPTVVSAPIDLNLGRCNRDVIGAVIGGATGGVLGSTIGSGSGQTAAIIGGTIIGVIVGGSVGRSMDEIDQNCVGQALESASDGQTIAWQGPDHESYEVTPTRTYQAPDGAYCREYTTEAVVAGKTQTIYGRSCRQPDGSWKLNS